MFKWISKLFKTKKEKNNNKIYNNEKNLDLINEESTTNESIKDLNEVVTFKDFNLNKSSNILNNPIKNTTNINISNNYEIISYDKNKLNENIPEWNSNFSYLFPIKNLDGYKLLKKDRIVGCYYRKENIDEIIETFNKVNLLKFNLILENDYSNKYDSNARKVSIIYLFENEVRKLQLGYLARETSLELKKLEDIKVSLIKIENINYKDTHLAIYLKNEVFEELEKKRKKEEEEKLKLENEKKLEEANRKVAYEMNQYAMALEKNNKIEEAIKKYEEAINLGFDGSYAFDRLNVYYRKNKDYDSEIENCKKYINLFENLTIKSDRLSDKISKYEERIQRATYLKEKHESKNKTKTTPTHKNVVLNNNMRTCTICNKTKIIEDFEKSGKDSKGNIKYKHQCKKCRNELRRRK